MFKGLGVAVITPFKKNYDIDFPALEKIIEHLISNGADYLVMLGTTGESVVLSKDEKKQILKTAISINNKRLPIVAGIGGNNTLELIRYIETFDFNGIDAVLSVSPYYNKPNQDGIYRHYKMIAEVCPKPIIIYNVPGRTSSNITSQTCLRLAKDFNNIIATKEASGNFEQIIQIVKNKPQDFLVVSGDDLLCLPQMSIGFDGVISVIGNAFPREFSLMLQQANTNPEEARKILFKLEELIRLIFAEGSPSGIKGLMHIMGFCDKTVRPPLYELSESTTDKLAQLFKNCQSE